MLDFNKKKENCTGCSACFSICPKHCISMKMDREGFLYPESNEQCINCGLCEKVCPAIHKDTRKPMFERRMVYAATAKNDIIWKRSTSGGGFSVICQLWGDNKTIVFGATWDDLQVKHKEVIGVENISPLCKSKYISSDLGNSFCSVKKHLEKKEKVIFCGTPCQVSGLSNYLQKSYDNLLLIDFICHGVGSPLVFQTSMDVMSEQSHKRIVKYEFRHKVHRYEEDYISLVTFEDGTTLRLDSDQYMQMFLSCASHRPCCGDNCICRNDNRRSDITIADARGMKTYIKKRFDGTRNYTHIIANSQKGMDALSNIGRYMYTYPCEIEDVIRFNPLFVRNVPHKNTRDDFFLKYVSDPQRAIRDYTSPYKVHKINLKRFIKLYVPKWIYNKFIFRFVG